MQHFSEEYRESLVNEHKLLSAAIGRLQQRAALYARQISSPVAMESALQNMQSRKCELEVQIDVLTEFLRD